MSLPFMDGHPLWTNLSLTGTNTYYSSILRKPRTKQFGAGVIFSRDSGTLAGTLTLEVTDERLVDIDASERKDGAVGGAAVNALRWFTYAPTGFSIPAISTVTTQSELIELVDFPWTAARFKYVNATGTGRVSAKASGQ